MNSSLMSYASFFYTFDDLPARPSVAQIRSKIKRGARRQHAFEHFTEQYPDDVGYRLGYVESYAENGVYDDTQYQHCYDWIEHSLTLPDCDGAHAMLRKLLADLRRQQEVLHAELGPHEDPPSDPFVLALQSGNYDVIETEFARLQLAVKPRGILGGDDERRFWRLFQMMVRIAFLRGQPEVAIEQFNQYEQQRIAVKMTPIPDLDLQEAILGYLAQQSLDSARARLSHWLANSRMPIIGDTIKQHDAFCDLCKI